MNYIEKIANDKELSYSVELVLSAHERCYALSDTLTFALYFESRTDIQGEEKVPEQ